MYDEVINVTSKQVFDSDLDSKKKQQYGLEITFVALTRFTETQYLGAKCYFFTNTWAKFAGGNQQDPTKVSSWMR